MDDRPSVVCQKKFSPEAENPGKYDNLQVFHNFPGFFKRLSGVEPPHMPPEGIALSTELQTHSGLLRERDRFPLK